MARIRKCFRCSNDTANGSLLIECETPKGKKKDAYKTVCNDCLPHVKRTTCYKCDNLTTSSAYVPHTTAAGKETVKRAYICDDCRRTTPTMGSIHRAGQLPSPYQFTQSLSLPIYIEADAIFCKNQECRRSFVLYEVKSDEQEMTASVEMLDRSGYCPFCGQENAPLF